MGCALLSLGSNIEPERHLAAALAELRAAFPDLIVSSAYRTSAVGFEGDDFVNAGALLTTTMDPLELDAWLHALEDRHGRRRDVARFSARTLDIDLVFYDDRILRGPGHLQLPRPELQHAFVLGPLAEIAPDVVDPLSGKRLIELWQAHPEFGRLHPQPFAAR